MREWKEKLIMREWKEKLIWAAIVILMIVVILWRIAVYIKFLKFIF